MDGKVANGTARRTTRKTATPLAEVEIGRKPPQAIDIEEAVLGALMLEKDALSAVIDLLEPETFYKPAHSAIFGAIKRLFANSDPVDIISHQLTGDGLILKFNEASESSFNSVDPTAAILTNKISKYLPGLYLIPE